MPITESDAAELYTKDEAAEFLHVSRSTIDRIVSRREIDYIRVGSAGGRVRISKRALLDFLNRRSVGAAKKERAS